MKRHAEKPTKMARGAARLAAALLALAAAGCGNAASSQPPPRDALSRRWRAPLFMGATPERPHRDIGLVQAFGAGNRSGANDVLHSLRREAQRMGCDALSNVDVSTNGDKAQAIGVCIRWL